MQTKKSLFSIGTEFYALNDLANDIDFNQETGEIINQDEAIQELFNDIKTDLDNKLDNSQYVIRQLLSDAEMLDNEVKRLNAKKSALENRADNLKKMMLSAILASEQKSIKTLYHSFTTRKSESVNIINDNLIPRQYLAIKYEAKKADIKKAIKDGVEVEGCEIVSKDSLTVK